MVFPWLSNVETKSFIPAHLAPGAPNQDAEVLVLREEAQPGREGREGREGRPVPLAPWRRMVRWSRYDDL